MKRCSTVKGNHADIQVKVRIELKSAPGTMASYEVEGALSSLTDKVMNAINDTRHLSRLSDLRVDK